MNVLIKFIGLTVKFIAGLAVCGLAAYWVASLSGIINGLGVGFFLFVFFVLGAGRDWQPPHWLR